MPSVLEFWLRSSDSGGREEGAISLGKESELAHCDQMKCDLSLGFWYLRPLRPEVYFVFGDESTPAPS